MITKNGRIYVVKKYGSHHYISEVDRNEVKRIGTWQKVLKFDLWHDYKWVKEIYVQTKTFRDRASASKFILSNNYTLLHMYDEGEKSIKIEYLEMRYRDYFDGLWKVKRGLVS